MTDVVVDVSVDAASGFQFLTPGEKQEIVLRLGRHALEVWSDLARAHLGRTKDEYINALRLVVTREVAVVTLAGSALAASIEEGQPAFDMKATHLKGRSRLIIPFLYASPEAFKRGASGIDIRARGLGRAGLRAARNLTVGQRVTRAELERAGASATVARRLAGLQLRGRPGAKFIVFRTMSERSSGWQHPGIEARHFVVEVARRLEDDAPEIIASVLA